MAVTITKIYSDLDYDTPRRDSGLRHAVFDVLLDSSYPTGGEPCDLSAYFSAIHSVQGNAKGAGYLPNWDYAAGVVANMKLMMFWTGAVVSTALAEVTNTTNLSAVTVRILVEGIRA